MANNDKRKGKSKSRRRPSEAYEPVRGPRLREAAAQEPAAVPPPLSTRALPRTAADEPAHFGDGDEDGLRILAALETMESLEPDFSDDPTGEASVTIIERAAPFDVPPALDPGAAPAEPPRRGARKAPDADAAWRPTFLGPIEEAVVEIFEVPTLAPAPLSRRGKKPRPVGQRFFKALTDGGKG